MSKMSINDAAERFGVSKEAIHNRVRRGSLEVVVEDGVKMVVVDPSSKLVKTRQTNASKANASSDKYHKLLEEQNAKLQSRVETLENETRSLRDQKELMLINERKKIEQIYKDKDEQLKSILNSLATQLTLNAPLEAQEETLEAEIEIEEADKSTHVSLKKHLKSMNVSDKKREKIKERFAKKAHKDERIIMIGSKCYIDATKYDYSDLIK